MKLCIFDPSCAGLNPALQQEAPTGFLHLLTLLLESLARDFPPQY